MKNVTLIEVTSEELGNAQPSVGTEILIRNVSYRIMGVKPPKNGSSGWRRRASRRERTWQLMVEKLDKPTASTGRDE
jgi:hypothetical protein